MDISPAAPPPEPHARSPEGSAQGPRRALGHRHLLARVRAEQKRALWLQGALTGGATLFGAWLCAGALGLLSPALGRALLFAAPLAATAVTLYFGLYLARARLGDDARVARFLGERVPGVSLDLLAAVELERQLSSGASFSQELAEAFLRQVADRASVVEPSRTVDGRPLRWSAGALAASLVLLLASGLSAPGLYRRLSAASAAGPHPSARAREPITGEVTLTYRFPPYTGLSTRRVEGTNGEVSAPEGTEVFLKTRSDRPVVKAGLLVNGVPVPLTVLNGRELAGGFRVVKSGSYAFVFYSESGKELARGPDLAVTAEPDLAPKVSLLLPAAELEVDPDQEVVLKYEASDDYGLTGLQLVYRVEGKDEVRVPVPHDEGRKAAGQHAWPLKDLHLAPGDRVAYFLEARDNNAVRGPQKGVSRTQVLKVYSTSEHRRAALARVVALWERLLKHLGDRLEGPDASPQAAPDAVAAQAPVDQQGSQLADDLLATARELSRERERPSALVAGLSNISESLRRAVHQTAQARTFFLRFRAHGLDFDKRLARAAGQEVQELEKDALYLESLLDRQRMEEMRHVAAQLAEERRNLTSLVEQFQRTHDPALRKEMLAQAQGLKRRIDELMQRMAELASQIQDEHLNMEALQKMAQEHDLSSQMDKVEKALSQGKTEEALLELQKLASQIDQMQKSLEAAKHNQGKTNPELVQRFQKFADALQKTRAEQQALAEQTKALRDRYKAQSRSRLKEKGAALKDQLKRQAEAIAQDYKSVNPAEMTSRANEPLERAQEELENLKNALSVEDYDLAAEAAERTERAADELANFGEQQARLDEYFQNPPQVKDHSRRTAQKLSQDAARARDINRRLQQLFPPPGSLMGPEDKAKLSKLGQQQHSLGERAKGLEQEMEQLNQLAPVFGEQGQEAMQGISDRMGEADERLGARDPSRGYGAQKSALEGLQRLQEQMQKSQSGGGAGGLPMPMLAGNPEGESGSEDGRTSTEKVEIPDQDQFQAPKEFRKDLLDAMKQGTPDKYRDQVKSYYEELVK